MAVIYYEKWDGWTHLFIPSVISMNAGFILTDCSPFASVWIVPGTMED